MGLGSGIEWTESTWNPVTGCTKISSGCAHCYAERMAERLQAMGQPNYRDGFELRLQPQMLERPLEWTKPQRIFVNSMSDLFHEGVPLEYIQQVFDVMLRAHWHEFQVLTKRADRLAALSPEIEWPANVWMGVSVENADHTGRIDDLRGTGARVKFLSLEPLIGPLAELDLRGIDWVITGGESGPGARPMDPSWVTDIRDQCHRSGVAFFFKQWGGKNKKKTGRTLEGRTWDEMPSIERTSRAQIAAGSKPPLVEFRPQANSGRDR
jgi:protein gp37